MPSSQSVIRLRLTFFSCKLETVILLFIIIYNNNPAFLPYFSKEKTMVHAQGASPHAIPFYTALFGMMVLTLGMGLAAFCIRP